MEKKAVIESGVTPVPVESDKVAEAGGASLSSEKLADSPVTRAAESIEKCCGGKKCRGDTNQDG